MKVLIPRNYLSAVICMCLFCVTSIACTPSKESNSIEKWAINEYFGLNLDQAGQVSAFHQLLENGSLEFAGKILTEWDDGMISDFDLSEGKISTTVLFEGSHEEAKRLFQQIDSIMYARYKNRMPLKQKEWIEESDESAYMTLVNFFDYKGYRIGVTLRENSSTKDEKQCESGSVRIGLAIRLDQE